MKIGTTIISTAEYMELRAMKDSLEARKAEIEENADKVLVTMKDSRGCLSTIGYTGNDKMIKVLSKDLNTYMDKIDRSPRGRLHFLFTGKLFKTKW